MGVIAPKVGQSLLEAPPLACNLYFDAANHDQSPSGTTVAVSLRVWLMIYGYPAKARYGGPRRWEQMQSGPLTQH
jgi:hypothetical protein